MVPADPFAYLQKGPLGKWASPKNKTIMTRFATSILIIGILFITLLAKGATDQEDLDFTDASENYIRFRVDGVWRDFSSFKLSARHDSIKISERTSRWLEIAVLNLKNIPEAFSIGLWDSTLVKAGEYRDSQPAYTFLPSALLTYQPKKGLSYQSGGLFNATSTKPIYKDSTIVIITELTDKKVRGTFSGILYQMSSDGFPPSPENVIRITDGSFILPMRR
jgi:hypothetical protein